MTGETSSEREADFYDERFEFGWDNLLTLGPGHRNRFRLMENLVAEHNFVPPVLDVGCGNGEFLLRLREHFGWENLEGSDFSEQSRQIVQRHGFRAFHIDLTDRSTFPDRSYPSLICSEVLEHVEDHERVLENMHELLEPGGKVLISVPHGMQYWSQHDEYAGHVRRYDRESLLALLKKHRYRVIEDLVWGAGIYDLYYRVLGTIPPGRINKSVQGNPGPIKQWILGIVYYLFMVDDLLTFTRRGPKFFVVAEASDGGGR